MKRVSVTTYDRERKGAGSPEETPAGAPAEESPPEEDTLARVDTTQRPQSRGRDRAIRVVDHLGETPRLPVEAEEVVAAMMVGTRMG